MNKKERNHIMNMNRGMKQKISMLLIACLLFTGYQGMTLPGRAAQEDEQNNAISVSGTEVKVQLLGEDLRRAAKEAIEKGERVNDKAFKGYSKDADLEKEYEAVFSPEKEVYEIPLDSISTGLSESLAEEEADLEVFVERDAQDLDNLVRKESKESLLLYDGNSQLSQLFPKSEETAVKKEETEKKASEELASDSNLPRNTELTGSELITFLYQNKSDHRITFQLSVDSNKYPKVVVSPKEQLFKELLAKLKKEEKNRALESKKNTENKAVESTEVKNTAAKESEESKAATETVATEAQKESASVKESTSAAQESSAAAASEVRLVSEESKQETKVETAAAETEEKAQTVAESKETAASETEKETAGQKETEKRAEEKLGNGFLAEVVAHYDEFLAELQSARFTQYSLNELGRKSQNAEIENFATVEVFYDKDAFDEDVVLEAKRLVKPEESDKKEGEKLTEEQVKAMKDQAIYDDSDALDIRFVSKADRTKEVEPKVPVSVRLTFDKEAVPEDASADTVAIHHIVEEKDTGKVKMVETVVRAELEKKAEEQVEARKSAGDVAEQDDSVAEAQTTYSETLAKLEKESAVSEQKKEGITKEFVANSFSAYIVTWQCDPSVFYGIRFHYVDKNFKEIGPTVYKKETEWTKQIGNNSGVQTIYYKSEKDAQGKKKFSGVALKSFPNFTLKEVGGQKKGDAGAPYTAMPELKEYTYHDIKYKGIEVYYIDNEAFWWEYKHNGEQHSTLFTKDCAYTDFYFIYELKPEEVTHHEKDISPNLINEKFIKDNQNGTYDLTLTGQVKKQTTKQKLDILFVYDNTAVMATGFNFKEKDKKLSSDDYASKNDAKSTKVKKELSDFMKRMSDNKDVDARFALVTMDGDKGFNTVDDTDSVRVKYDSSYFSTHDRFYKNSIAMLGGNDGDINIVGDYKGDKGGHREWLSEAEDDAGKSHGFNVHDEAYNDTKNVYGFTNNSSDIIAKLNTLDEKNSTYRNSDSRTISGENYASAMKNVKVLMGQGGNYEFTAGGLTNGSETARSDAEKIVVFIAGGNPKFATIPKNGDYDDTHRYNNTDYYMIRRDYKEGWSYGNGYSINFPALNQARGELSTLKNVDAFYSIGVGSTDNWKYLNDFAMGQGYNQEGNIIKVTENGVTDDFLKFHPDRRERALSENVRYQCYNGSSAENLHTAFQGIYTRVARNQVQNIKITDVLTKYVQPFPQNNSALTGQLVKMKENGVEVDHVLSEPERKAMGLDGFEVNASKAYSSEYGRYVWTFTLTTTPADFSLPAGYDIRLVAKVEPTQDAKDFLKNNPTYPNVGDERTDLNDIYTRDLHRSYVDPNGESSEKFNTSAGKPGLFTNEKAEITYKNRKPDGSTETPPGKNYKKPVIRVEKKGFLKINKDFFGMSGKLYDGSSHTLTSLGKKIAKNIRFEIRQREKDGSGEQLLTTINLGDDLWVNGSFQQVRKFRTSDGFDVTVFPLQTNFYNSEKDITVDRFTIDIDNLPLNKDYQIIEKFVDEGEIVKESETGTTGYKFDRKDNTNSQLEQFNPMSIGQGGHTYVFTNRYKTVTAPKSITIRKVVEEFGGTAFTPEAKNKKFDFYIALYRYDGSKYTALSFSEVSALVEKWRDQHTEFARTDYSTIGGIKDTVPVQMPDGTTVMTDMPKISLKHGESIKLQLDADVHYKILEFLNKDSEVAEYEVAKAEERYAGHTQTTVINKVHINKCNYSSTSIYNEGKEFTFKNPRITLVPTGLRGDFTPYVLCLCGFTFMAGVYLSIKKKKREEV